MEQYVTRKHPQQLCRLSSSTEHQFATALGSNPSGSRLYVGVNSDGATHVVWSLQITIIRPPLERLNDKERACHAKEEMLS
ncbi:unnamed protein product [Toxocara canis]|uniref:Uncharacterized protein n=1 Tax=Toxocara canis TaxID=6265 RepID=A0A183TVP8_TOXCA|nr:unnamed protein product [Toxocara canis]